MQICTLLPPQALSISYGEECNDIFVDGIYAACDLAGCSLGYSASHGVYILSTDLAAVLSPVMTSSLSQAFLHVLWECMCMKSSETQRQPLSRKR